MIFNIDILGWFIGGTLIGSFLNVLIYRIPRHLSIIKPGSHCPHCQKSLRWYMNVPIWSFIWLRGRCAYCQQPISFQYPLVEFLSGCILAIMFIKFGMSLYFFKYSLLFLMMLVLSAIDLRHRIIPDRLLLILALAGIGFSAVAGTASLMHSLISAAGSAAAMSGIWLLGKVLFRKDTIGGGDIKLVIVLGIYLVWYKLIIAVFLGFLIIAVFAWVGILLKKITRQTPIPMAPFLSCGLLITVLYGYIIWHWYMHQIY